MKLDRPFTPWHGDTDPPVGSDTKVEMKFRCGKVSGTYAASKFIWRHRNAAFDIVGWRLAESS